MQLTVEFFAQLGRAIGSSSQTFEVEGPCTVQDMLQRLAEEHGEAFRELVLDADGRLRPSILLFIGDRHIPDGASVELHDRDRVLLATPIAGG